MTGALILAAAVVSPVPAAPFLDDFESDSSANYTLEDSFGTGGLFDVSGGTLNVTTGANNTATVSTIGTVAFEVGYRSAWTWSTLRVRKASS